METIDFAAIREKFPIEEYISLFGVRLRRSGSLLIGKCPIHREQNGEAFKVDPMAQRWRCWGKCNRSGDLIDLEQALNGGTVVDAVRRLVGHELQTRSKIQPPNLRAPHRLTLQEAEFMARASVKLRKQPELGLAVRQGLNLEAVEYVASDGDLGFVQDLELGTQRGPALIFGYSNGLKARWPGKIIRWWRGSAADRCWRDSLLIDSHKKVYLTEGETDTLALIGDGFDVPGESLVVALPSASAQIDPTLFAGREVTLAFDNDDAGQKATKRIGTLLRRVAKVRAIDWKAGLKA